MFDSLGAMQGRSIKQMSVISSALRRSTLNYFRSVSTLDELVETLACEHVQNSHAKDCDYSAFFLHGLLGSARNWRSFSRSLASTLAEYDSEWKMVLVDLRNHGMSAKLQGLAPPNDMRNAARDIADLVKTRGFAWPDIVVGHSMGGKVALQFAESAARGEYGDNVSLPKQLWVLDSVPGKLMADSGDGEVELVIKTLQSLPSSVPSRRWVVNHMMEKGFSKSLSDWVGSNLKKAGDHEEWTFNLEGAIEMFNSYRENSYWTFLRNPPKGMEIHIVIAEKSDRWEKDTIRELESLASRGGTEFHGSLTIHRLPKSGHWVHVDNPAGLLRILADGFRSVSS